MTHVIEAIEKELVLAARRRTAKRRTRRKRRLFAVALSGAALAVASGASAISGQGPIADVLGVKHDDPLLRLAREVPDGARAVVKAQSETGEVWRFAVFEATPDRIFRVGDRAFCFTQVEEAESTVKGLRCVSPTTLREVRQLREGGITVSASGSHGESSGVLVTFPVHGFVPADARKVVVQEEGGKPVQASLSKPIHVGPAVGHKPLFVRAFLGVVDSLGDQRLTGSVRLTATAELADGSEAHTSMDVAVGFPLVMARRPKVESKRVEISLGPEEEWATVAYEGANGSLCTSAAPHGERLFTLIRVQCSEPLAIIDAFQRYGVAAYTSDTTPPGGERGTAGSYAVRGFARADARSIVFIDQTGRHWPAKLSDVWTTAVQRAGDLGRTRGGLRTRLQALPHSEDVRAFAVRIRTPPPPHLEPGLRIEVELADGSQLSQP